MSDKIPDPVPQHPLLEGKPEIARGRYSIVLDKGDGERVYKIITHPDEYLLYAADDRPQGPHFPTVYAYHGIIGRASNGFPMHLFEVEKLYPIPETSPAADAARRLIHAWWDLCQQWQQLGQMMGRIALQQLTELKPPPFDAGMKQAVETLARFAETYRVIPDLLSRDNLMMRKDGTLVFSDPIRPGKD